MNVRSAERGFELVVGLKDPGAIERVKFGSGTCIHHERTAFARLQLANTIKD